MAGNLKIGNSVENLDAIVIVYVHSVYTYGRMGSFIQKGHCMRTRPKVGFLGAR